MINTYCLPYTGKRYVTDAEFFSMIGGIAHDINRTMNNVSDVVCRKGYSLTKNQVGKGYCLLPCLPSHYCAHYRQSADKR